MNEAPIFAILRTTIGFSSTTQPIVVKPSGAGLRTMIRCVSAGLFTMVRFPATILFTVVRSSSISLSTTMRLYSIALGSEGLPQGCGFLSTKQANYLAAKFREVYEARTYLRDSQVPQERQEFLERLEALREELRFWKGVTTLPLSN